MQLRTSVLVVNPTMLRVAAFCLLFSEAAKTQQISLPEISQSYGAYDIERVIDVLPKDLEEMAIQIFCYPHLTEWPVRAYIFALPVHTKDPARVCAVFQDVHQQITHADCVNVSINELASERLRALFDRLRASNAPSMRGDIAAAAGYLSSGWVVRAQFGEREYLYARSDIAEPFYLPGFDPPPLPQFEYLLRQGICSMVDVLTAGTFPIEVEDLPGVNSIEYYRRFHDQLGFKR